MADARKHDQGPEQDQPQDEVQLTELLPVQQSRFSETSKDADATDALKALRSFPHSSNDEFNERFNFRDVGEGLRGSYLRKRKPERWKHLSQQLENEEGIVIQTRRYRSRKAKEVEVTQSEAKVTKGSKESKKEQTDDRNEKKHFLRRKKRKKQEVVSAKSARVKRKNKRNKDEEEEEEEEDLVDKSFLVEQENNNIPGIHKFTYRLINPDPNEDSQSNQNQKEGGDKVAAQHKMYGCVLCDARFKGTGGLRNHYKVVHGAGPIYKCNECGKEFPLKERLKLHVRTHTGFRPYKCNECDKTFARGGQLAQHRRTHSQEKPYTCTLCCGMFTCSANLTIHMKRHNGQKDHKCEICGRGFVRRDALKKHMECLHQDVKSFLCVICNKTFKGHLPQHMRTHAHDRPHGCATCGQRFAQKSQLTVHQRTHSGQRPFRCVVCWQAFAHSTALKLHTRRHTGERPFKCIECNAGFTQLPHWKKHMRCIHGRNEPYCCKNCKTFFRMKSDLEIHEKSCVEASQNGKPDQINYLKNSKYCSMNVEKMRLLLAVLLKRISKPERLEELGFGKRLIDEILEDSLVAAGKEPIKSEDPNEEYETLRSNLELFLEWTVPQEHWKAFLKKKQTPEQILEALTAV